MSIELGKEEKYEESYLCSFYFHNDCLSYKPTVQGYSTSCVQCLLVWMP